MKSLTVVFSDVLLAVVNTTTHITHNYDTTPSPLNVTTLSAGIVTISIVLLPCNLTFGELASQRWEASVNAIDFHVEVRRPIRPFKFNLTELA